MQRNVFLFTLENLFLIICLILNVFFKQDLVVCFAIDLISLRFEIVFYFIIQLLTSTKKILIIYIIDFRIALNM